VDHFTLCCYAKKSIPDVTCISKDHDGFSSCDELLKNTVLKYCIWILGITAIAGNLVVIIWRAIAKDVNRVNSFLLANLAVSDLLMGVYMLIIAFKDNEWDGVYFKHDFSWRGSDLCKLAGVISILSSEVSVLTLTVITFDRVICIVFLFRVRRWSVREASAIMCVVWILGFCISLAPLFHDDYFYDYDRDVHFFGRSAVCLPLQLSSDRPSGWEYSVSVFVVLNGVSFLFILLAYASIYHTTVKSANTVRVVFLLQASEPVFGGFSNFYGPEHESKFNN
jgi:Ca2+/Na+ antiporter